MQPQNYFHIGFQKTIENPMVCLFAMGFYSIAVSRRGETFVTRKITIGLSRIVAGLDKHLELGNLYAMRDWGHAMEYAKCNGKYFNKENQMTL